MRFSFNVDGQRVGNTARLKRAIADTKPAWVLIMNNLQLANEIDQENPGTNVIHRRQRPNDADLWRIVSPEQFAESEMGGNYTNLWHYLLNEPLAGDDTHLLVKWLTKVCQIMTDRGFKVVPGNFAVGTWQLERIRNGEYDPLLEIAAQRRHAIALGAHEYTAGCLPFGVGRMSRESLLVTESVREENWTKPAVSPLVYDEGFHHLLRSSWFQTRAHERGYGSLRFVVTEFGMDWMDDLGHDAPDRIIPRMQEKWGASGYPALRGVYSYRDVWKAYWSQWDFTTALTKQLEWADQVYPPAWEGFLLFQWGFDNEWSEKGFNVGADGILHQWMATYTKETPMIPFPDTNDEGWEDVILSPPQGPANVRQQPDIKSLAVGGLREPTAGQVHQPGAVVVANWRWYPVRFGSVSGWMRADVVDWKPVTAHDTFRIDVRYLPGDPLQEAIVDSIKQLTEALDRAARS